jgi:dienelactone hydrolase
LEGVFGEGLLVQPRGTPTARVVVLPDADQTPEMLLGLMPGIPAESQFARRLAEAGCQLVIPVLLSRSDEFSGSEVLNKFTNQPHREWIYRQAFEMGRHVIGYEVQKILSALDWFDHESRPAAQPGLATGGRIGVAGYGEGGLLALYSAAVDPRIETVLVSGYFGSRQDLWQEPIYRNVFGLLEQFGDAEIASLVVPRSVIIEASQPPAVQGPPAARDGRSGAAPGRIAPADLAQIQEEVQRAHRLVGAKLAGSIRLPGEGKGAPVAFGSAAALDDFLRALQVTPARGGREPAATPRTVSDAELAARQRRQVRELEDFTQKLVILAEHDRAGFFWNKAEARVRQAKGEAADKVWSEAMRDYKDQFWSEIIGRLPPASLPVNARTRLFRDEPGWRGYIVVLDVFPEVIAYGYLLVPKDLAPGERRPAIVCQHGGSSTPDTTIDPQSRAYRAYAVKLVERGYVVFSPYNVNYARGRERLYDLQRLANPLKKTIYSIIAAQHDRVLDFLSELPFVDAARIGYYGLSYGGKTAMRIPAILDRYAVTICSGDFNDWVRKTVSVHAIGVSGPPAYRFSSYMFGGDYEIFEFDLARTFNYAEMAALIAPRPFMVERGHFDRVASDEWVAYEYAKVRRLYNTTLKLPERTTIEYFDGGHEIHGQGTFEFLQRHLQWPR